MSEEDCKYPSDFPKIIKDFITDLIRTFPDKITRKSNSNLFKIIEDQDENSIRDIYKHCKEIYPKFFFDILYENKDIFDDFTKANKLLLGVNFNELWNEELSDHTRTTIWKYFQLMLFSVVKNISSDESFGETAKLFEAINSDEFKGKIEETISEMGSFFNQVSDLSMAGMEGMEGMKGMDENLKGFFNRSGINLDDLSNNLNPNLNAEEIHDHINGMMNGKLGCLAKEIADETAQDLNIDVENTESINDVFKQLFKNPGKLMGLVKNVGSKLDNKIKSGEIKESEILEEATDLMSKMKNMPGMNNLQGMFSKMGMPGMPGGKVDMNAFEQHMNQNLKNAKMRERMKAKLEERERKAKDQKNQNGESNLSLVPSINDSQLDELNLEQSAKLAHKKKRKGKGKKK